MINEKRSLSSLLASGEQIIAPCIWDCFSARVAELTDFKAALVSSAAVAYSITGLPDVGLLIAVNFKATVENPGVHDTGLGAISSYSATLWKAWMEQD